MSSVSELVAAEALKYIFFLYIPICSSYFSYCNQLNIMFHVTMFILWVANDSSVLLAMEVNVPLAVMSRSNFKNGRHSVLR